MKLRKHSQWPLQAWPHRHVLRRLDHHVWPGEDLPHGSACTAAAAADGFRYDEVLLAAKITTEERHCRSVVGSGARGGRHRTGRRIADRYPLAGAGDLRYAHAIRQGGHVRLAGRFATGHRQSCCTRTCTCQSLWKLLLLAADGRCRRRRGRLRGKDSHRNGSVR